MITKNGKDKRKMKELTLEEVKIYVLEHFCEYLPECYQKSTLRVESVVKNNQRLTGISLAGVKISPTIYLENIYEEYLEHKSSLCQILRKKANLFYERMKNGEEIMTLLKKVKTMSKEEIGKHLFLSLVQTKNNHALLEHRIHRKFLDLSVLCNYEFTVGKELLSIGLSKMLLDQIQLSEEEAFNLAYKNSCARGILRQDATFYSLVKLEMRLNPELEMPDVHLAYVVCQYLGLDTSDYSFAYVAGWGSGRQMPELRASLHTIQTTAADLIDRIEEQISQTNARKRKAESEDSGQEISGVAGDYFEIYQLKENMENRQFYFMDLSFWQSRGVPVEHTRYDVTYTAPLDEKTTLDDIYCRFNIDRPSDFFGHSLSVSDVVVLHRKGKTDSYFVDNIGFQPVTDFFKKEPKDVAV